MQSGSRCAAAARRLFLVLALVCVYSAVSPQQVQAAMVTVTPTELTGVLLNPGKGWVIYDESGGGGTNYSEALAARASVAYNRWGWASLEPAEGSYNWDLLDDFIDYWAARGKQVSFGIMAENSCATTTSYVTPQWVFTAGAQYTTGTVSCGTFTSETATHYTPVWNDAVFLQKYKNMLTAIANRYANSPHIANIQVRSYGNWGEQHTIELQNSATISAADLQNLHFQMHLDVFDTIPLVTPWGTSDLNSAYDWAVENGIGMARDGVPNVSNGSEVTRAYGNAIGVLEWFCTYTCLKDRGYWSTTTDADNIARARANYENLGQWGSDGATFLSEQQAYIDATQNTLGYHFVLTSASLPNTISNGAVYETSLTWNNKGVSYLYEPARLAFALLNPSDNSVVATHFPETGANPQRLAPGITTEAPTFSFNGVANGSYKLAVGVFRKTTDANPSYNLAITGKTAQGWYPLLENVTVSGSSTYTPRLFTYETEFLSPSHSTGKPNVPTRDVNMSSGMGDRFQATAAGQAISYPIDVTRTGTYHIKLKLKQSSASGKVQLDIDGTNQGGEIDLYAAADNYLEIDLGTKSFASTGTKQFRLTVSGKHASSTARRWLHRSTWARYATSLRIKPGCGSPWVHLLSRSLQSGG
jgi:hypothetical protein